MAERDEYVLDATILAKWHLRDEPQREEALAVRTDHLADRIRLLVPDLVFHEVSNAILKATRNPDRKVRLTYQQALREVELLTSWGLDVVPSYPLNVSAYRIASRYGCSYYDAVYLALSESTQAPLLHADSKLRSRLEGQFPHQLWVENYAR